MNRMYSACNTAGRALYFSASSADKVPGLALHFFLVKRPGNVRVRDVTDAFVRGIQWPEIEAILKTGIDGCLTMVGCGFEINPMSGIKSALFKWHLDPVRVGGLSGERNLPKEAGNEVPEARESDYSPAGDGGEGNYRGCSSWRGRL